MAMQNTNGWNMFGNSQMYGNQPNNSMNMQPNKGFRGNGYSQNSNGFNNGYSQNNNGFNNGYSQNNNGFNNGYSQNNNGFNNGYNQNNNGFPMGFNQNNNGFNNNFFRDNNQRGNAVNNNQMPSNSNYPNQRYPNQNQLLNPNQYPNQNQPLNPNQYPNQNQLPNPNQYPNQNQPPNLNQYPNQNRNRNPNQNQNRNPNQPQGQNQNPQNKPGTNNDPMVTYEPLDEETMEEVRRIFEERNKAEQVALENGESGKAEHVIYEIPRKPKATQVPPSEITLKDMDSENTKKIDNVVDHYYNEIRRGKEGIIGENNKEEITNMFSSFFNNKLKQKENKKGFTSSEKNDEQKVKPKEENDFPIDDLKEIIQNEKNAAEFYDYLSKKSPLGIYRDSCKKISKESLEHLNVFNKIHKNQYGIYLEPSDLKINDNFSFERGLLKAMEYENSIINDLVRFIDSKKISESIKQQIKQVINKKQFNFNSLAIIAFDVKASHV